MAQSIGKLLDFVAANVTKWRVEMNLLVELPLVKLCSTSQQLPLVTLHSLVQQLPVCVILTSPTTSSTYYTS
jgi:hypothetical protein